MRSINTMRTTSTAHGNARASDGYSVRVVTCEAAVLGRAAIAHGDADLGALRV